MKRGLLWGTGFVVVFMLGGALGSAKAGEPLVKAGDYLDLQEMVDRQEKQVRHISSYPFGWSLDVYPASQEAQDVMEEFIYSDSEDLQGFSGKHLYELASGFEEYGDLGMFGGVPAAGMAFRYMVLKRDGVTGPALDAARVAAVRAAQNMHVFLAVTGTPGVIARGIRRLLPENAADPIVPGAVPELVPFKDENGNALPEPKDNGTWRPDNSKGVLPAGEWIWVDSASKDQWDGFVFGMAALYDALKGDPDVDQALVAQMEKDALDMGRMLMQKHTFKAIDGKEYLYDLIIMDADGRPTKFHDLHPYIFEGAKFTPGGMAFNTFNLITAIGILKGLHHVSGDPEMEKFYYDELMLARKYWDLIPLTKNEGAMDYIYGGKATNYSNVNMVATSLFTAIYYETDPDLLNTLQLFMKGRWWEVEGVKQSAKNLKNPFFNALYLAMTYQGTDSALVDESLNLLGSFAIGPYLNRSVVNCDAAELDANVCLAIDGQTSIALEDSSESGKKISVLALDPGLRPPSNFDSRSSPFDVNGGGGLYLNAAGDLMCAWWLLQWMESRSGWMPAQSPYARSHDPMMPPVEPSPESGFEPSGDVISQPDTQPQEVVAEISTPDAEVPADVPVMDVVAGTDANPADATQQDVAVAPGSSEKDSGCSAQPISSPAKGGALLLMTALFVMLAMRRRVRG